MSSRAVLVGLVCLIVSACGTLPGPDRGSPQTSSRDRLATLSAKLRRNPNDARTLVAIGRETARMTQWTQSMSAYREALIVDGSNREARMGYARGLLATGQYGSAESQVAPVLSGGASVEALLLRAGALTGQARYAEAEAVLTQARGLAPRDLDVRSNLALVRALAGAAGAYAESRAVAFAPDADIRHQRNLVLVGGITGQEAAAAADGAALGLAPATVERLTALGRESRDAGMRRFGIAPVA